MKMGTVISSNQWDTLNTMYNGILGIEWDIL